MEDVITTSLIRKVMILALLVAGTLSFSRGAIGRLMPGESSDIQQSPTIILTPQEDSPIQILSTWIASAEPKNFRVVAQVQNQSLKGIRACAFISQTATNKLQNGKVEFMNFALPSTIWLPTAIRTNEFSDSQEEPINTVRLTVDFVEFTDGTTWGPDSENSRDMLAGQRAGAKLERLRLLQLMLSNNFEGLVRDIQTSDGSKLDSVMKDNHSSRWQHGFSLGVAATRRRVNDVIASGDRGRIKTELTRPFDTAEEDHQ